MRVTGTGARTVLFSGLLALSTALSLPQAHASPTHTRNAAAHGAAHGHALAAHSVVTHSAVAARHTALSGGRRHIAGRGRAAGRAAMARGGISCVPFARRDSGIEVSGNAWQWWDNASGHYARGKLPEVGSVLAFRSNPRMRLGHVAVIARVVNAREVTIDHANWSGHGMRGAITRDIPVVDVSEANDWSAVRVGLGRSGEFGSVYPTYGFIYDRPDTGVMLATVTAPTPQPTLNPAPVDLRPVAERPWRTYEEVAEAPATAVPARQVQIQSRGVLGAIDRK